MGSHQEQLVQGVNLWLAAHLERTNAKLTDYALIAAQQGRPVVGSDLTGEAFSLDGFTYYLSLEISGDGRLTAGIMSADVQQPMPFAEEVRELLQSHALQAACADESGATPVFGEAPECMGFGGIEEVLYPIVPLTPYLVALELVQVA